MCSAKWTEHVLKLRPICLSLMHTKRDEWIVECIDVMLKEETRKKHQEEQDLRWFLKESLGQATWKGSQLQMNSNVKMSNTEDNAWWVWQVTHKEEKQIDLLDSHHTADTRTTHKPQDKSLEKSLVSSWPNATNGSLLCFQEWRLQSVFFKRSTGPQKIKRKRQ